MRLSTCAVHNDIYKKIEEENQIEEERRANFIFPSISEWEEMTTIGEF